MNMSSAPVRNQGNLADSLLRDDSPLLDKVNDEQAKEATGASLGSGVLNLSNTLLGGGIAFIALPEATKQVGVTLLCVLIMSSMVVNAFTCTLLIKSAEISGKATYFELAGAALGKWSHLVTMFIFLNNLGVCVAFIATFGDVFPEIKWHGAAHFLSQRLNCVIAVSVVLLLPMLTLKNLDSLRFLSACSIVLCLFFVSIVVASASEVRGTPPAAPATTFVSFLQALSVVTLSFTCHYNVLPIRNGTTHYTHTILIHCTAVLTHTALIHCTATHYTHTILIGLRRPAGIRTIVNLSMACTSVLFCIGTVQHTLCTLYSYTMACTSVLFCIVGALSFHCHPDTTGDILSDFNTAVWGSSAAKPNSGLHDATFAARLGVCSAMMFSFPLIAYEGTDE
jgi:amino acid permease